MGPIMGGVARMEYLSTQTNVVFDGNSLVAGSGASTAAMRLPAQLAALAPISGGLVITNLGIGGQTTRKMNGLDGGSSADVDAAYVDGKRNVLMVWEATNSIADGGRNGPGAVTDMTDYIAARLAAHPDWKIVLLTTIPREASSGGQATHDLINNRLVYFNTEIKAHYRSMGAAAVVDVRQAGSPYDFATYTPADFAAGRASGYWQNPETYSVHLNDAGYGVIAQYCANVLRRLPAR